MTCRINAENFSNAAFLSSIGNLNLPSMNKFLITATGGVIFGIPAVLFTFYGIFGGMPWDYSLTYLSESQPGWQGFLYHGDSLRIYTNVFYHIGYWISKISGQTGSWVGYHLIYCMLLAGKGLLVFLICRLLNLREELSALAAVISLLHGSDSSLGHVGQLNQFGIVVWVLLSMCAFLLFLKQQNRGRYVWLGMAPLFSYLALWSYEGTLVGLLLYPILFLWVRHQTRDQRALGGALFTTLPAIIYFLLWMDRIFGQTWSGLYQARVVRNDIFDISAIFRDFWGMALRLFNITDWININTWRASELTSDGTHPFMFFSLIVALILLIYFSASLGISTYRVITGQASHRNEMTRTPHVDALRTICTLFLLIASFLMPFVALKSGNGSWRTQILPGPFASILGAIIITYGFLYLLKYVRVSIGARCAFYSIISLAVLSVGFVSITERYRTYNRGWEPIRAPIARLLQTIPAVRPGTVIMLQNVPTTVIQWGSNYWFDILLRLCYPNTKVSGSYTFASAQSQSPEIAFIMNVGGQFVALSNGKSILAPHGSLHGIEGENVTLFLKDTSTLIDSARLEDVIVLDWTDSGPFKIIRDANQIDLAASPRVENYHPESRIISQTASPIALRRFARLLPEPLDHNISTGLSQK